MSVNLTDAARRLRILVLSLALAGLASASAQAGQMTYDLVQGTLGTVQLLDPLSPGSTPCPIGGSVDCLVDPLDIDAASVTIDTDTGQIFNLTIVLDGTGTLDLSGLSGYETATFTGTSFQSDGIGTIAFQGGSAQGSQYNLNPYDGDVGVDELELFESGDPAPVYSGPYGNDDSAPFGGILLTGDELTLTLLGVNIGVFTDPVDGQQVIAKADFNLVARAQPAIPEPNAAILFGVGVLTVRFAAKRKRTA